MPILNRRNKEQPKRKYKPNKDLYNSERWHAYSRAYRKKNRLCVHCLSEGITKISECVDHITPIEEGGDVWSPDNHQALCLHHHSVKTKKERNKNLNHE